MILIDQYWLGLQRPTAYGPPDPLSDNIRDLDHETQQILTHDDLPVGNKARLYKQLYNVICIATTSTRNGLQVMWISSHPPIEIVYKVQEIKETFILQSFAVKANLEPPSVEGHHKAYKRRD